ncbi:MAG: 30S ribosomal protein S8 [Lachnospiraceae bacterium]|nr:30S ribosomal protein S8 [Lachnospiraceae bacterium]
MNMSDPIADMLTRIRNANTAKFDTVNIPASKMKKAIAEILFNEGYIEKYELVKNEVNDKFEDIKIYLKYFDGKRTRAISGIDKVSKPGLRMYSGKDDMPQVLNGLGIAIVSTNLGVMTDKDCRKNNVGGEILARVW